MGFFNVRSTAALLAAGLAAPEVAASVSFTDVWYPNGNIDYFIQDDADDRGYSPTIEDVMQYMIDHTPLDIDEVSDEDDANLRFAVYWGLTDLATDGGLTNGYWDEDHADSNKKIRFDPDNAPGRSTVTHEFGHALGRPHEFQREERNDYVDVCFNTDPYNYSKVGSAAFPDPAVNLSPYDYGSIMNSGYGSCVTPEDSDDTTGSRTYAYSGGSLTNLLSPHDVNGIYRMYGDNLGTNDAGDRFGIAVSSGDYDHDGYDDVVVANDQGGGLWLEFYRGVALDESEGLGGLKWMPWFKEEWQPKDVVCQDCVSTDGVVLATGDFNGDGVDDVAVGLPDQFTPGMVSILFVNTLPSDSAKDSFENDFAPWGRWGIQSQVDLRPEDFGLSSSSPVRFGAALAAVRATNYRNDSTDYEYHDLAIGAPNAVKPPASGGGMTGPTTVIRGAVVLLKGSRDTSPADFNTSSYATIWNPQAVSILGGTAEFGAAIAGVPKLCALTSSSQRYFTDYLAIGDPARGGDLGAVYIYGCATSGTSSTLSTPSKLATLTSTTAGRYGQSLAGFTTLETRLSSSTYDAYDSFLAIGKPFAVSGGSSVGQVLLRAISETGTTSLVTTFTPGTTSGDDEFGTSLAVYQRPYADDLPDTPGPETYIGVGMPGTEVDGVPTGKVVALRPWNSDGTVNTGKVYFSAYNPDSATPTRFGQSIAVVRTLAADGGFVVGAPDAITGSDGVYAGEAVVLQNGGDAYEWDGIDRVILDQETEGDQPPTN